MDMEEQKRRQRIWVIVSSTIMSLSVVAIVVLVTLLALGYNLSGSGDIDQSGLLQVHSVPTGATVKIDDEVLFARTNTSRSIPSGQHTIELSREGYDTWSKEIRVDPGHLVRLYYPRIFPQNRTAEEVKSLPELEFYSVSLNRNAILYSENDSPKLQHLSIRNDDTVLTELDISEVAKSVVDSKFTGRVDKVQWSENGDRVLLKIYYEDKFEWVLLNTKDVRDSINLTQEFGINFDSIKTANSSADRLYGLECGNLRAISVADQKISKVIVENVKEFDNNGFELVYLAGTDKPNNYIIGTYKDGEKGGAKYKEFYSEEPVHVATGIYYDDHYLAYTIGKKMTVISGDFPSYSNHDNKYNNAEVFETILEKDLDFVPNEINTSRGGEYYLATNGNKFAVADVEILNVYQYEAEAAGINWIDDGMLYSIVDGRLKVRDFDGTNKRDLAGVANFEVVITGNNKWLYYVSSSNDGLSIYREKVE